nr:immunoglobulin light chain junction region [Macaca mulatta]
DYHCYSTDSSGNHIF